MQAIYSSYQNKIMIITQIPPIDIPVEQPIEQNELAVQNNTDYLSGSSSNREITFTRDPEKNNVKFYQDSVCEKFTETFPRSINENPPTPSSVFIQFQIESFIEQVKRNLDTWSKEGTDNAISYIADIKRLLRQYEQYLTVHKETRLLLGGLELIFANNNWEQIPTKKIARLADTFGRFKDGIAMKDIRIFIQEMHAQKISVLAHTHEEKK